jgi:hypothetical protein
MTVAIEKPRYVEDEGRRDLHLNPEQIVVLRSVEALKLTFDIMQHPEGVSMRLLIQPALLAVGRAALASMRCPYGNPPSDIECDFDSSRNMYQRCNHNPRHCWEYATGRSIDCPV